MFTLDINSLGVKIVNLDNIIACKSGNGVLHLKQIDNGA